MRSKVTKIYKSTARLSVFLTVFLLLLVATVSNALAQNAVLTWTAPTTDQGGGALTGLAGYRVHYGNSNGIYTTTIDVGNVTTYPLSLAAGTYFFVVNAYDPSGNQGPNSNQVSKVINVGAPTSTPTRTPTPTSTNGGQGTPSPTPSFTATPGQNPSGTATPTPSGTPNSSARRTSVCAPSSDSSSMLPILSGRELRLVNPTTGAELALFSVPKRQKGILGDLDGQTTQNSGLGTLDMITVDQKMTWTSSTSSSIPAQHLGSRNGQAMLCHADKDALLDYSVSENRRFMSRSSASGRTTKLSLKKLGQVQALACGQIDGQSLVDRLVVVHSKQRSAKRAKLSVSILDIESGATISSRSISPAAVEQILIADIDGDGEAEPCALSKKGSKSNLVCSLGSGERTIKLPKNASQVFAGNFIPESSQDAPIVDEFAVLTRNGKVWLVLSDGSRQEVSLTAHPFKGNPSFTHCR